MADEASTAIDPSSPALAIQSAVAGNVAIFEDLTKAHHCACLSANGIHEALAKADAVEAIVLLRLVRKAHELCNELDELKRALKPTVCGGPAETGKSA